MNSPFFDVNGARVSRLEDYRLITGNGKYAADWYLPGQLYGHFLRSERAHARMIDGEFALDANGKFLAMRLDWIAEVGAYMTPPAAAATIRNSIVSFTGASHTGVVWPLARNGARGVAFAGPRARNHACHAGSPGAGNSCRTGDAAPGSE